jgi:hypothetical protein
MAEPIGDVSQFEAAYRSLKGGPRATPEPPTGHQAVINAAQDRASFGWPVTS